MSEGWIGIDLDGTLAEYDGWKGVEHIGKPIPSMVERVKAWIIEGKDVRIFTARVCMSQSKKDFTTAYEAIAAWCRKYIGKELKITAEKDWKMIKLWDDRCVSVIPNTGEIIPLDSNERVKELEKEKRELLAKCEKYECEIELSKQRIAALESKRNMYIDLSAAMASSARKVDSLEKERDRFRESLREIAQWDILARSTRGLVAVIEVLKDRAREALEGEGE